MAAIIDVVNSNVDLDEEKIKAMIVLQSGLTSKRIDQYIAELLATGIIKRENGKLTMARKPLSENQRKSEELCREPST